MYPELLTDLVHYYLQPDFRLDAVVKITQNFQITVNLTGLLINPLTGEFTCVIEFQFLSPGLIFITVV